MAGRWYESGLRFACQRCGGCCRGEPGFVWVSEEETETLARSLNLGEEEFARKYLRKVGDRWSLIEMPNGDCVFYGRGCAVYAVRPAQCRTFPFWPAYLASPYGWKDAAARCPGVGQGRLFSAQQIEERLCELRVHHAFQR